MEKIRKEAKYVHRHHQGESGEPWYRLSVWVDSAEADETLEDTMTRLVHAAGLANIQVHDARNSVFWLTTVRELEAAGFHLKKDGDPDERDEHYSVDLGPVVPTREVVESFVAAFRGPLETGRVK